MGTVGAALEHEHHEIDEGVEGFISEELGTEERVKSLRRAIAALHRHIFLEEAYLFPPMKADLAMPTMVMLREHGEIWRSLDRIEAGLDQDQSEESTREACRQLLVQLDLHNSKEEPIFYESADATLGEAQTAVLTDLVDDSEMPDGWVCQNAEEGLPPGGLNPGKDAS